MKKSLRAFVLLVLTMVLLLQSQLWVLAAGASKSEATQVLADNTINYGTVESRSQVDWYFLQTGEESAYYSFTIHNESGSSGLHLVLYSDRDEQLMHIGDGIKAGTERTDSIKLQPESTYYIKMYFYQGGRGNYYFRVDHQVDDAGESRDTARQIAPNQWVESAIERPGDRDYYVFQTGSSEQEYMVELYNHSGTTNAHVLIYSARDEQLLDVGYYTGAGDSANATVTLNPDSTYYAIVYLNEDGTGNYGFIVSQCVYGHTVSDEWITVKEPACDEPGEQARCCSVCGEILESQAVDAKGHTWGEWEITKEATWLSLGEKQAVCNDCPELLVKKEFSKIWILPVVILAGILTLVGVINYIRSFFR